MNNTTSSKHAAPGLLLSCSHAANAKGGSAGAIRRVMTIVQHGRPIRITPERPERRQSSNRRDAPSRVAIAVIIVKY
jgi:hypothetical protein